jgi:hypothetical protein
MNLRFVHRPYSALGPNNSGFSPDSESSHARFLQQLWVSDDPDEPEQWRDVPLSAE